MNLSITITCCLSFVFTFDLQSTRSISRIDKEQLFFLLAIIWFKEVCKIDKKFYLPQSFSICIVLMPILAQTSCITKAVQRVSCLPAHASQPFQASRTSASKIQKSEAGLQLRRVTRCIVQPLDDHVPFLRPNIGVTDRFSFRSSPSFQLFRNRSLGCPRNSC